MNEMQLKQLEKLEHEQHAMRLVLVTMLDMHPNPEELKARLTVACERVISNSIASPRMAQKTLDAIPKAMQPWLDVLDRRLQLGL